MRLWDEFVRILNLGRLTMNTTLPSWGVSRLNWFSRNRPTLFWSALQQQQTVWRQQTSVVGRFVYLFRQDRPPSLSIFQSWLQFFSLLLPKGGEGKVEGWVPVSIRSHMGSYGWRAKLLLGSGFRNEVWPVLKSIYRSPSVDSRDLHSPLGSR